MPPGEPTDTFRTWHEVSAVARWVKGLLLSVVALALAALLALVAATRLVKPDRLAAFFSQRVRVATSRDLTVTGGLRVRLFPHVAVVAEEVRLGNVSWGSRPDMLQVRRVEGSIPLLPLLRGEIQVDRLVLVEPRLFLETDPAGTGNWELGKPGSPAPVSPSGSGGGSPLSLRLSSIAIEKGSMVHRSGKTGEETRLSLDRLTLERPAFATTNTLDIVGTLRGQPFTLTGQVGVLEKFFSGQDPLAVDLAFATDGATATLAGRLVRGESGPLTDGRVKVRIDGTASLAKLVGRPISMPVPLDLAGRLAVKGKTWRMDRLEIASGRSTASGSLVVRLDTPRPEVTAVVESPFIDLPELAGWKRDDRKDAKIRGRHLFSDAPLPFGMLQGFDGRLQLKAVRLALAGRFQPESTYLDLDLRNGRLKIDPLRLTIGGGSLSGTADVDATPGRTPTVSAKLEGGDISLERLAADLGHPQSVAGGRADLSVSLSGSGASVRSIMSTLDGELRLSSGPAKLTALALPPGDVLTGFLDTINPFRKKDEYTDLTCAVVRLPVRDGLITIDRTVAYETRKVATAVAGTISLDSEALDLAIRPAVKSGFGLAGAPSAAQFVRITGTLAEPKIELSTLATARTALSAGGAIATGGLSLIGEALFKKASADYHPCRTALEKAIGGREVTARPAGARHP